MQASLILSIGARFWIGFLACIGAGYLAFRGAIFRADTEAFQVLTVGALAAAILALGRSGRWLHAMAVAVGYGIFKLGWIRLDGWVSASSGMVLGFGLVCVTLIFEILARKGLYFGKFLVVGPLVGGVFLAVAPLEAFRDFALVDASREYLRFAFLGVVIGDGVGFGVEVADLLLLASRERSAPAVDIPAPRDGTGG